MLWRAGGVVLKARRASLCMLCGAVWRYELCSDGGCVGVGERGRFRCWDRPSLLCCVTMLIKMLIVFTGGVGVVAGVVPCPKAALRKLGTHLARCPRMVWDFSCQPACSTLAASVDTDFAGGLATRRSTSGGVCQPFSASARQSSV